MTRALAVMTLAGLVLATCALGSACSVSRDSEPPPTYNTTVASLLAQRCVSCHGRDAPAGGWRASSYLEAIGCVADGRPAVLPTGEAAPILRALANATHAFVPREESKVLTSWVRSGAPKSRGAVHAPGFVDPRSPASHGRLLRAKQWRPMLDPEDAASCGRCHDGAPARPASVTSSAPGAPSCTSCHQEPSGALGCTTCHGQGTGPGALASRAYPPRDRCFFPEETTQPLAHAAHVEGTASHVVGIPCSTCHPAPGDPVMGGTHGDGKVDVRLDPRVAGASAAFDAKAQTCTTTCHARPGGARPRPAWTDRAPMRCGDCHGAPPADHPSGPCSGCHREANEAGTGLVAAPSLHIDGKVDLGDGSGTCGACHGDAGDPWPSSNAHPAHRSPTAAAGVACSACHTVPTASGPGTGHPRGGPPTVLFSGIANAGVAAATYTGGSCRDTYCHGGRADVAAPIWTDRTGRARTCGACHALPPAPPHPSSPACELCHRDATVGASGPGIAPQWAQLHVNGVVDRGGN